MTNSNFMNELLCKVPDELKRYILSYLIPDPRTIGFNVIPSMQRFYENSYSDKYKTAFINESYTRNNFRLTRIEKKNNKHRYYLTKLTQIISCDGCGSTSCRSRGCRSGYDIEVFYDSTFIGKDLNYALVLFLSI